MKHILLSNSDEGSRVQRLFSELKTGSILCLFLVLISYQAFSQGPGSPYVNAGDDVTLACGEDCTELTAQFLDTGETTQYEVSAIDYNPPFPFTGGEPVSVDIDDRWSPIVPLPFDFCFFEETYDQMLIGSNAVITFDLINNSPNGFCEWSFDIYDAIPSTNLHLTSIMAPYMDVDPSVYGSGIINWYVDGEAPNRSMVINFPTIPYYGCNSMSLTSQVVLYETTNVVEIYVENRPSGCYWQDGVAVLGIQNQTGTQGYTPPGRNTSDWQASQEAWRFTPSGDSNVDFAWLDEDGEIISSDRTITVCPTEQTTTYTAKAIWLNCNGDEVVVTDDVTVTRESDFTVDLGEDQELCNQTEHEITAELDGADPSDATFVWSTGETTQSIIVTESGTYSVEVTVSECTISDSVSIIFNENPEIDLGPDQASCFGEPIVLDASPLNYSDPSLFTYEWSRNGVLLTDETNPVLEVNEPGNYQVVVSLGECIGTALVTIDSGENPEIDLGDDRTTCFDQPEILDATPTNYNDPSLFTYQWSRNGETMPDETEPTLAVFEPGYYGVTVSLGSCFTEDYIQISPADDLEVEVIMEGYGPSPAGGFELCPKEPRTLKAISTTENSTYQWYLNGDELSGETNSTLEISLESGTMGMQTYSVTISSQGCTGSDELDVRLYEAGNCVISQGLTPNGDGFNDVLDLTFLNDRTGIRNLQIFNRYGTKVYEQKNYINQWFGQTNDGKDLPTGTYYYVIDMNGEDPVYGQQATGWIYLNQKVK